MVPFLRNTPLGPKGKFSARTRNVLMAVFEVEVPREAVPHQVIRGLVALEPRGGRRIKRRAADVDRIDPERQAGKHGEHQMAVATMPARRRAAAAAAVTRGPSPSETPGPLRRRCAVCGGGIPCAGCRRAAPSCARTPECQTTRPSRGSPRRAARVRRAVNQMNDRVGQRARITLRAPSTRRRPCVRTSHSPSASVETIALPAPIASNTVKRGAFPQRREHRDVERAECATHILDEAAEDETIAQLKSVRLRPAATRAAAPRRTGKNRACGFASITRRAASTRYSIALRVVQARDGPHHQVVRPGAEFVRGPPRVLQAVAGRPNSSSGAPRYTTFTRDRVARGAR